MSVFAKISIVGLAVIAVVAGALYWLYNRGTLNTVLGKEAPAVGTTTAVNDEMVPVVTGIKNDDAITTNALKPSANVAVSVETTGINDLTAAPVTEELANMSANDIRSKQITDARIYVAEANQQQAAVVRAGIGIETINPPPPKEGDTRGENTNYSATQMVYSGMDIYHNGAWYQINVTPQGTYSFYPVPGNTKTWILVNGMSQGDDLRLPILNPQNVVIGKTMTLT